MYFKVKINCWEKILPKHLRILEYALAYLILKFHLLTICNDNVKTAANLEREVNYAHHFKEIKPTDNLMQILRLIFEYIDLNLTFCI